MSIDVGQSGLVKLATLGGGDMADFKVELEFSYEKETKNTVRYKEDTQGQPPKIGTLYIQQWALDNPPPTKIQVTIE